VTYVLALLPVHGVLAETAAETKRKELSRFQILEIKRRLAKLKGIPASQVKNYELDHKIALALGGTNPAALKAKLAQHLTTKTSSVSAAKAQQSRIKTAPRQSASNSKRTIGQSGQKKTVNVPQYKKKDGNVVQTHKRSMPTKKGR
jgi:hypothetical protein